MFRVVKIGEQDVPMLSMASVDVYYKQIFHEDPLKIQTSRDEIDAADAIDLYYKMGFVMAKFAELKSRQKMLELNYDAYLDWLDKFGREDLIDALEAIQAVYDGQKAGTSQEKKEAGQ